LPEEFSEEEIQALFSTYGEIQKIRYDAPKNSGYVKFVSH